MQYKARLGDDWTAKCGFLGPTMRLGKLELARLIYCKVGLATAMAHCVITSITYGVTGARVRYVRR